MLSSVPTSAGLPRGRPTGSTTFDPVIAECFGRSVLERRIAMGLSQLSLAEAASLERAHMGRIERGERIPNLVAVVKIAAALGWSVAALAEEFERKHRKAVRAGKA